jgi:hypothetical protein
MAAPQPALAADPGGSGGGTEAEPSSFRRLPKELISRVVARVRQQERGALRLSSRAMRAAVDGLGWQRLQARALASPR